MERNEVGSAAADGSQSTTRPSLAATGHEIGVSNHVVKVIEVLAESPQSWEDAARIALREASRSLHGITSIYVKDMQAIVRDGHVAAWRVNAKVSFVINDRNSFEAHSFDRQPQPTTEGEDMRHRNQDQGREGNYRQWRGERDAFPEGGEYGLHGDDRREYRGRESYEQQTRGGQGGRSGMWDHRNVPRDLDQPYRNNADEDRRGYQNIGTRQEFEGGYRNRHEYGRFGGQGNDRDYDDARYGFDSRDYGGYPARESSSRDYSSRDSGNRDYGRGGREYGGPDRWSANRYPEDDYSRTDYGDREYYARSGREQQSSPYSRRSNYNSSYDQEPEYPRHYGSDGSRSWGAWPEQQRPEQQRPASFDQGRIALGEYGRSHYQRRTGQGPRGYRRSDERIREDVCDRLGQDWDVDASEVEVTVSNGEVTLAGTISDRAQKFRVEHLADAISGVTEVHNQLRVKRELPIQSGAQGNNQNAKPTTSTSQNRSS
jgi:osmotically-inducible protein OsmY/flavin-binding protein dodecin